MIEIVHSASPEERAEIDSDVQALLPELWGVLSQRSPTAAMTVLATIAAYMIMSAPDAAEGNLNLFVSGIVDRMVKIRLLKADLGGLPN